MAKAAGAVRAGGEHAVIAQTEPGVDTGAPAIRRGAPRAGQRLLFVVNDSAFFVSHRLALAQAAREAGFEVHLAALDTGALDIVRAQDIVYHPLPLDRTGINVLADLGSLRRLWQLVGELRPSMLHAVTIKPVIYGGLVARARQVPALVCTISGLGLVFGNDDSWQRGLRVVVHQLYRTAFAHPNVRVIFQNPDDRDHFLRTGLLPRAAAALIRGSGVDMTLYRPAPEPAGPPVVLLPVRMLWPKGVAEFVAAARQLRAAGLEARFVLVGSLISHHRAAVPQAAIDEWLREGVIEWWGHCTDMPATFAQSTIVCLPSYYREGVPKALIEAAACSRPIVTTDMPGCREVVRHGENGLLVPPRAPEALAAALRELIERPDRRAAMGRAGRALALAEFSLERVIEQTLAIYQQMLEPSGLGR